MLVTGAVLVRKWLLAPESTMAHWCILSAVSVIVSRREGGVGVERSVVVDGITDILVVLVLLILISSHRLFAPDRQ